jgi:hypothetical protein
MPVGSWKIFNFDNFLYSRQIMLQFCELYYVSTDTPRLTAGFCFDNQVITRCHKSERLIFSTRCSMFPLYISR